MVVNHKGRLVYATSALGALLGFPVKALVAMDLQAIIPPPYSQLHTGFLKVRGCGVGSPRCPGCCWLWLRWAAALQLLSLLHLW